MKENPSGGEVEADHQSVLGSITVDEILKLDLLSDAIVLAGREGLTRRVERLNVMSGPEILPWTKSHEFMLTSGFPLPASPEDFVDLVRGFADKNLSALGIKFGPTLDELPEVVVRVADELALPLIRIPADVSFDDILGLVLSEIVNRQNAALSRVQEILDSFLEVVLAGRGLGDIVTKLSDLLGGALVVVSDEIGHILTPELDSEQLTMLRELGLVDASNNLLETDFEGGANYHRTSGLEYLVSPIRAGSIWQGTVLVVGGNAPLDSSAMVAVEQAAIAAALDRMRQVAISTVTRQFEASILHDVITGRDAATTEALIRSTSVNWDFDREQVVLISSMEWLRGGSETRDRRLSQQQKMAQWAAEVRSQDPHAATAFYSNEFVAVVGIDRDNANEVVRTIWRRLQAIHGKAFSLGVSRVVSSQEGIPRAHEEARTALRVGLRAEGPGRITSFDSLGLFRLLSLVEDRTELHGFVQDTLKGLLALEPAERDDLLLTLRVLLDSNMNTAASARKLFFHYNTVRYRMSKLEGLLGPFSTDSRLALQIGVALQVMTMPEWRDC